MTTSSLSLPSILPIARYRLTFEWLQNAILPAYAGSTLRGAFGHALLEQVCICASQNEHHAPSCPYSHIFANPHRTQLDNSQKNTPPQPYLFELPIQGKTHFQAGETYSFGLVLFGQTRLLLSLIVSALEYAFQKGVGKHLAQAALCDVAVQTGEDWQSINHYRHLQNHQNNLMLPETYPTHIILQHLTPLRLQHRSKICQPKQLTADLLLRQTMRRVDTIAQLHWQQAICDDYAHLCDKIAAVSYQHELYWHDMKRYSNRQHAYTPLGGVLGTWQLHDVPPEFAALLYVGQWLHIGKETVFGLGGYRMMPMASPCFNTQSYLD